MLAFVSVYRMGDVLTLTLSHPLWNARGYSLNQIAMADGAVALLSSMAGVAIGGWMVTRWRLGIVLAIGAIGSIPLVGPLELRPRVAVGLPTTWEREFEDWKTQPTVTAAIGVGVAL